MLEVKNIEKYYGSRNNVTKALDRVSFQVEDGDFLVIMGASGSGKTTLLNCISTIDTVVPGISCWTGSISRNYLWLIWPGSAGRSLDSYSRISICWTP